MNAEELARYLESTAQQLTTIIQEEQDPDMRQRKFMSVVQPVFYWLGSYERTWRPACDRIGQLFVEV